MRLSVNLEPDLYAVAKSLAKSEDCSLSSALNRLVRRGLKQSTGGGQIGVSMRNKLPVSQGTIPITADLVQEIESEG